MTKSKGYSLHIGLDVADPKHYKHLPKLKAAVRDAVDWQAFAKEKGYVTKRLVNVQATSKAVKRCLESYSKKLKPGDILLITYSGHGGEIPNEKSQAFDDEAMDQTWCLYDREFIDDEIFECCRAFQRGVRITIVSDSCHSGTVARGEELNFSTAFGEGMTHMAKARGFKSRKLPKEVSEVIYARYYKSIYKGIQDRFKQSKQADNVKASIKLLAACQDDEETLDGSKNGLFTDALLGVLRDAEFSEANAEKLIDTVRTRYFFPYPNFFQYGGIIPTYDLGSPFSIEIPGAGIVTGDRKPEMAKSARTAISSDSGFDPWSTLENSYPAVIVIESDGMIGKYTPGPDVKILQDIPRGKGQRITVEIPLLSAENAWSAAHALKTALAEARPGLTITVEPVLSVNPAQKGRVTREGDANNPDYIKEWPPSLIQGKPAGFIGWHLDDEHSQLAKAFSEIKDGMKVRIAHFDTGIIEHKALPPNLKRGLGRSFVDGDPNPNEAIDKTGSGQDGHGLGTITILAGNKVTGALTFNEYHDKYIGGAPFAEVIPVRVSESVVILNSRNFCDAIEYAIETECEVVSMSMAGKPSKKMAKAVNAAYDAGIVLVTAASNCWYKGPGAILPKCVMFPAAFERVIAATGAMYDHKPYDVDFLQQARVNIGTKYMQGAWGPPSRMKKALAGYTPNIPWASTKVPFLRSGGGTSSATPQVAAAAATWLAFHRVELDARGYNKAGQKWKRVEAVRTALYESAAKANVFPYWEKYYGNGILRAHDALLYGVPADSKLLKAREAESSFLGVTEIVGSFFKNRRWFRSTGPRPDADALTMELLDLLQTDSRFYKDFSMLDLASRKSVQAMMNDKTFRHKVTQSPYASSYLKMAFTE